MMGPHVYPFHVSNLVSYHWNIWVQTCLIYRNDIDMDPTGFVSVLDIDGISHISPQLILG